jgi:hypothetical protein
MEAADTRSLTGRPVAPGCLPTILRPITSADRELREAMGVPLLEEHRWMLCVLDGNPGVIRKPLTTERAVALVDDMHEPTFIDAELLP